MPVGLAGLKTFLLQWGRDLTVADRIGLMVYKLRALAASMGPRPDGRG